MPDTEPRILATVRNVSFGNTPRYFDLEPPKSLISLVKDLLSMRIAARAAARAWVESPWCTACEGFYTSATHETVMNLDSIYNWFRAQGRRWNRYQVGENYVFCTKGDDLDRFFAVVCDRRGHVPCCGCGSYGMRVERDVRGPRGSMPGPNFAKTCPICEGRGSILCSPDIAKLTERPVTRAQ